MGHPKICIASQQKAKGFQAKSEPHYLSNWARSPVAAPFGVRMTGALMGLAVYIEEAFREQEAQDGRSPSPSKPNKAGLLKSWSK